MEQKVNNWLKPLLVDIIKDKPDKVMDYVIDWCETNRQKYEKEDNNIKQNFNDKFQNKNNFDF